jgi:hypothetical protein
MLLPDRPRNKSLRVLVCTRSLPESLLDLVASSWCNALLSEVLTACISYIYLEITSMHPDKQKESCQTRGQAWGGHARATQQLASSLLTVTTRLGALLTLCQLMFCGMVQSFHCATR